MSNVPTTIHRLPAGHDGLRPAAGLRRNLCLGLLEVALTAAAIFFYLLMRAAAAPDDTGIAVARTLRLLDQEQELGIAWELPVHRMAIGQPWLIESAGAIYLLGMYPVLVLVGLWVYVGDPRKFRFMVTVMLISAVAGLVAYHALPTAPPRLLAAHGHDLGFVDFLHDGRALFQDRQPPFLINDYAAVPSYHFSWMLLPAAAIWSGTRRLAWRFAAVGFLLVMGWAIVATANHLVLDILGGIAVLAVSWLAATALARGSRGLIASLIADPRDSR